MVFAVLTEAHIPLLAELYVETYNAPPWSDAWTVPLATKRLDEMICCRDAYGLACLDSHGAIVGMVVGSSETYYNCAQFFIKDFFIIPAMQGQGFGSALLAELECQLLRMGVEKTYLFTAKGVQTEHYYQRCGYASWNGMVLMGKLTE